MGSVYKNISNINSSTQQIFNNIITYIQQGSIHKKAAENILKDKYQDLPQKEILKKLQKEEYLKASEFYKMAYYEALKQDSLQYNALKALAVTELVNTLIKAEKFEEASENLIYLSEKNYFGIKNYLLGEIKFASKDYRAAISYLTFSLEELENNKNIYDIAEYNIANIYFKLSSALINSYKSYNLISQNQVDKANYIFEKALEINFNMPELYYNLGLFLNFKNENILALEKLNKAIELDPKYIDAYLVKSIIFLKDENITIKMQGLKFLRFAMHLIEKIGDDYVNPVLNFYASKAIIDFFNKGFIEALEYIADRTETNSSKVNSLVNKSIQAIKSQLFELKVDSNSVILLEGLFTQAKQIIAESRTEIAPAGILEDYLSFLASNNNASLLDPRLNKILNNQALAEYYNNFRFTFLTCYKACFLKGYDLTNFNNNFLDLKPLIRQINIPIVQQVVGVLLLGSEKFMTINNQQKIMRVAKLTNNILDIDKIINELAIEIVSSKKNEIISATLISRSWFDTAKGFFARISPSLINKDTPQVRMAVADASKLIAEFFRGNVNVFQESEKLICSLKELIFSEPFDATLLKVNMGLSDIAFASEIIEKSFSNKITPCIAQYVQIPDEQFHKIQLAYKNENNAEEIEITNAYPSKHIEFIPDETLFHSRNKVNLQPRPLGIFGEIGNTIH